MTSSDVTGANALAGEVPPSISAALKTVTYGDVTTASGLTPAATPVSEHAGGCVLGAPGHTPRHVARVAVKIPLRLVDGSIVHVTQPEAAHLLAEGEPC